MRTHVEACVCGHKPAYATLPRNSTKQIQTKLSLNVLACFPNRRTEKPRLHRKTNKPRDKSKNKYLTQEAFRA